MHCRNIGCTCRYTHAKLCWGRNRHITKGRFSKNSASCPTFDTKNTKVKLDLSDNFQNFKAKSIIYIPYLYLRLWHKCLDPAPHSIALTCTGCPVAKRDLNSSSSFPDWYLALFNNKPTYFEYLGCPELLTLNDSKHWLNLKQMTFEKFHIVFILIYSR